VRRRRLRKEAAHLEITAFINLIVVLVPFLLSTAVFTRLAVMDLQLPTTGPAAAALEQLPAEGLQLQVVIRADALEVGDRTGGLIQRLPRGGAGHDHAALSALLLQVKERFPAARAATLLAEPDTSYDDIVQVMDAVRSRATVQGTRVVRSELFPDMAVGDAAPSVATTAAKDSR
jgi:biopolymer transport protein ExbD